MLVPTFGDITLDAATTGPLGTDFGLTVRDDNGRHVAHARYGDGRSPLRISSGSGQILLDQLVLMGEDGDLPEDDD
jgi:hypothetical protein